MAECTKRRRLFGELAVLVLLSSGCNRAPITDDEALAIARRHAIKAFPNVSFKDKRGVPNDAGSGWVVEFYSPRPTAHDVEVTVMIRKSDGDLLFMYDKRRDKTGG